MCGKVALSSGELSYKGWRFDSNPYKYYDIFLSPRNVKFLDFPDSCVLVWWIFFVGACATRDLQGGCVRDCSVCNVGEAILGWEGLLRALLYTSQRKCIKLIAMSC